MVSVRLLLNELTNRCLSVVIVVAICLVSMGVMNAVMNGFCLMLAGSYMSSLYGWV